MTQHAGIDKMDKADDLASMSNEQFRDVLDGKGEKSFAGTVLDYLNGPKGPRARRTVLEVMQGLRE